VSDLDKLIEAVDAGKRGHGLNTAAEFGDNQTAMDAVDAFDGSIDAAKALHDALLPDWVVKQLGQVCIDGSGGWSVWLVAGDYLESCEQAEAKASTPARAWLLAILRAYRSQVQP